MITIILLIGFVDIHISLWYGKQVKYGYACIIFVKFRRNKLCDLHFKFTVLYICCSNNMSVRVLILYFQVIFFIWLTFSSNKVKSHEALSTETEYSRDGSISKLDLHVSCIQVILIEGTELTPSLIRYFSEVSIFVRNFDDIEQRNITDNNTKLLQNDCQNFVIVTVHLQSVVERILNSDRVRFLPFSRIFFVQHNVEKIYAGLPHQFRKSELNYVYENAAFVYILSFRMDVLSAVQDVQTGIYLLVNDKVDIGSIFYNDWHKHQFIHIKNEKKEFRIGVYNCSPYVIYLDDNGTK